MKITRIETFLVAPRWLLCRVETDEGLAGWGEPVVEGRAETVRAAVGELSDLLMGEDPAPIEHHWQRMTKAAFYRGGPVLSSAVAGLDQALWDLAGKRLGVPVHRLLGGPVRDRVRVYGWVGGDDPARLRDAVAARVESGLTAVKMNAAGVVSRSPTVREIDGVVERLSQVREVLGDDRDVAVDFHGRFTAAAARRVLPLLEPLRPMFAEEPVLPEFGHLLEAVVRCSPVPVATGERLYSRGDFLPALQAGIAVAQPDLSHAGGVSEVRRIAALAETYDALVAPHCPLGPVALAASLQVAFATPNFLIQEQSIGIHYNRGAELLDYVLDTGPFGFADGAMHRTDAAGLGIEVDEDAVRTADRAGHRWRPPVWSHRDGSFAEW
ncbi:galactonate dehydratase [Streptomonospora wellingtoniae]|uniref:Galactonate dehydratase n=1 Tax=Streptomonospora wellingtoniae TaxID=3075544 RepID=A0ABU2L034_9ACTN|nr:galactonate dehydratase [Streptomonospora sp. DSM 45055]MDT0304911.1 galactonate dehydratase [Streptomonospora sp. DSM 45055]